MRMKSLLAGCLVLWAGVTSAQATQSVSGVWSGTLGPDENNRTPVRVQLKVSGKNVTGEVTGPQLIPGDITRGTFDAQSGALRFTVALRGGDGRPTIDFEGAIVRDTLTAHASGDGQTFIMHVTRGETAPAPRTTSPPAGGPIDTAGAAVKRSFVEVSGWVTRAAALVPAEKYTYRPVGTVRTFGQIVAHVADAYLYYCSRAQGKNVQWSDAIANGATDKATVTAKLQQSLDVCNAAYGGRADFGPLIENAAHTSLHYGNLVTYIRMLGLVPPSS